MLVIVGPTASGKSAVALEIADRIGGRVLSLDSMQVYRGMDIGTAKASADDQARVPHHMIDLVDPSQEFSVQDFQKEARRIIDSSRQPVVLVGGSGLHMRAVIDPLEFLPTDEALRAELEAAPLEELVSELLAADAGTTTDLANPRRVIRAVEVHRLTGRTPSEIASEPSRKAVERYESLYPARFVGLDPGDRLPDLIDRRLEDMLGRGFYSEVEGLVSRMGRTASQAVGYKELAGVVRGECSLDEAVVEVRRATLALARRQRSWFRRDPRISWVDPLQTDPVAAVMGTA
jgi:tRNA dimethylallyltransferase